MSIVKNIYGIFSRFSLNTARKVKQDDADYLEVKLRYIKPKEIIS